MVHISYWKPRTKEARRKATVLAGLGKFENNFFVGMEVTGECSAESSPHLGSPSLGTQCQPARTWRHRRFLAQDLHRPARLVEGNGCLRIWKTRCSDGYRERPLLEGITCEPPLGHPMEVIYIPAIVVNLSLFVSHK